jgi:hypothetical protein
LKEKFANTEDERHVDTSPDVLHEDEIFRKFTDRERHGSLRLQPDRTRLTGGRSYLIALCGRERYPGEEFSDRAAACIV